MCEDDVEVKVTDANRRLRIDVHIEPGGDGGMFVLAEVEWSGKTVDDHPTKQTLVECAVALREAYAAITDQMERLHTSTQRAGLCECGKDHAPVRGH